MNHHAWRNMVLKYFPKPLVLKIFQAFGQFWVRRCHQASKYIAVSTKKFGGTVYRNINAEVQRTLHQRGHKGVVEQGDQLILFGDFYHGSQIGNREERIGRGLKKESLGLRRDGVFHGIEVGCVNQADRDSLLR